MFILSSSNKNKSGFDQSGSKKVEKSLLLHNLLGKRFFVENTDQD